MKFWVTTRGGRRYRMPVTNALGPRRSGPTGRMNRPALAPALAPRTALRAKTATVLQRRRRNPYARRLPKPARGGSATFSSFKLNRRANKQVSTMKKVGAPNYYNNNLGFRTSAEAGFQAADQSPLCSITDLKMLSTYVPTASGANQVTRYVLESATNEFLMTNNTTAACYVDIYDIIRKRDASSDFDTANPVVAWVSGLQAQVPSGGTGTEFKNLGCLPGDSRLFRDYFKVLKRTHIGLHQGATHRHLVTSKVNKIVGKELLDNCSGDLAGFAIYTMIVVYGQPDSVAQEGAPALVSTAPIALDIVVARRYKFSWVQDVATNYYFMDNLSTLAGSIVNQGSGAIELVQEVNP